jgi:NitT/TauT family transport system ATP-binding protein
MIISVRGLSFGYTDKTLFDNLFADFGDGGTERPLVILGPSGSGKTTLLKLLGGLLKPLAGEVSYSGWIDGQAVDDTGSFEGPKTSYMFQEPRLLPWLTVLENVSLPLLKIFDREEAVKRAGRFLSLVSLEGMEAAYPARLSGGQAQRVSMARAFAWPAPALFMDEPFQSLDIPLRINLMETCLSLLEHDNFPSENCREDNPGEKRLLIAVTHDPREALYMGGRIVILGKAGEGIVFDRVVNILPGDRAYGSASSVELEREIIRVLEAHS